MIFKLYKGICVQCEKDKWIVNSRGLCADCVYMNNHGGKTHIEVQMEKRKGKPVKVYRLKRTPLKRSQKPLKKSRIKSTSETIEKRKEILRLDRETYLKVFNSKENYCEECNAALSDRFEDDEGNIIDIFRFSHILSKSTYPEFRHKIENFNILCLQDHQVWDFGDKENMRIYKNNQKIIQKIKSDEN